MKRIKHNDLTHYFMTPHEHLPASYLASCEKFFKRIKKTPAAPYKNFFWPTIPQRQAASTKRQAPRPALMMPQLNDNRIIKEKYMQKKKKHKYKPTATLKDYKEAIQILMVDYADVWEKTDTFKEVDEKLKKLGI